MPDATGLELIAQRVRGEVGDETVTDTVYLRGQATLEIAPAAVREVLGYLKERDEEPWGILMSLHGCDYLPAEPRLGVHYQLLSMERADRLNVRTRVSTEEARVPSVVDVFPTANFQEREVYDMFGVVFEGHPDLRRILMPEDYGLSPAARLPHGRRAGHLHLQRAEAPALV